MSTKSDYLELASAIRAFRGKHPRRGNQPVHKLLHYHLYCSTELLLAEVNGGLDSEYEDEAKDLP